MEASSDYYATLRVRSDADDTALRLAYRELMRRYHPDVNVGDDAAGKCHAINEAYACLRDPAKRAAYDARRRAHHRARRAAFSPSQATDQPLWGQPRGGMPHSDGFKDVMGIQGRKSKAAVIGVAIVLTIATFAATSAVDGRQEDADEPIVIQLRADPRP